MNTEEKFVHPDIQTMKTETSLNTLRARILTKLQVNQEKNSMSIKKNVARLGFTAGAAALVVIATMVMTNTANAVEKVHAALQDANRYHVKSYMIKGDKRTLTSETWVEGEETQSHIYDASGKPLNLNFKFVSEVNGELVEKLKGIPPHKVAEGNLLGEVVLETSHKLAGKAEDEVFEVVGTLLIDTGEVATDEASKKDHLILGSDGSLFLAAPLVVSGQNGVAYLRKLLSDKDLWNIRPGLVLNGRTVDKYSLKKGYSNLELFVDPRTELPYITRTSFEVDKQKVTIEDVYDYVSPMPAPPVSEGDKSPESEPDVKVVEGYPLN